MFKQINIVPRWVIFTLDLTSCTFSLLFAYYARYNFHPEKINKTSLAHTLLVFLIINCVVFIITKTYAGIVRYTSAQDLFRILLSVGLSNIILYLFSTLSIVVYKVDSSIPLLVLIVNGLSSFLLLMTYRILVKYVFMYIKNLKLNKRKVIIYGATEKGITTKRILDHDSELNMNIVGFVDDDLRKCGKVVENVRIYHLKDVDRLIRTEKINDLIIADPITNSEVKNMLVDICLLHNVHILNVPPITNWVNGQFHPSQIKNIKIEDVLERESIQINNELIENQLYGKTILVTGAAGSIGSELVRQLIKHETGLIILNDVAETALHHLQLELQDGNNTNNFIPFIGDVRNIERMSSLFETYRPDYVYHASAYKHVPMMENNPSEAINTNVLGTKILADLSMKYGVDKFVMISTDKAVNPTNVMGASKRIAEMYVQSLFNSFSNELSILKNSTRASVNEYDNHKTKYITTRFGNVLGSNGSVIPRFKEQIQKGGPITVTHPDITRYFMTIPEACSLVLEAGSMGNGGEIFIFDMGKSVKIVDLAKKMIRLSGFIVDQDIKITYTGLRPGEKLYEELLNNTETTMPTHHEKIMIASISPVSYSYINKSINELLKLSATFKDGLVVRKMKEIVPEYKSENSIFEEFDKEISARAV